MNPPITTSRKRLGRMMLHNRLPPLGGSALKLLKPWLPKYPGMSEFCGTEVWIFSLFSLYQVTLWPSPSITA